LRTKLSSDPHFAARFYRALCVFMADRLRQTTQRMGYGAATDDKHAKDELNEDLLDNVHLAGARFDRMLKRLAG
jgi:CRP/FNR family transcriptional regulator, cyclic AMP receptor protein